MASVAKKHGIKQMRQKLATMQMWQKRSIELMWKSLQEGECGKKCRITLMWKSLQEGECGKDAKEGSQGQNQKYHAGVLHSHHHPKI